MSRSQEAAGTDWRARYRKLTEEQELAEKSHAAALAQLTRIIARVCVATSGIDPFLDPHLDRLRKIARSGDVVRLEKQANEFADAIVKAGDERREPPLLQRLLEHASLSQKQRATFLKLWAELAENPARIDDGSLDKLLGMLEKGLGAKRAQAEDDAGAPGLLGRLLRKDVPAGVPNLMLKDVLDAIEWPTAVVSRVSDLRDELDGKAPPDAWVGVVRQISDLVIQALDSAHREASAAEKFLAQLNDRLESLDQHMLSDAERREASRVSGERLGETVRDEVGGLSDSVRGQENLVQLQSDVIESLERIQGHVASHLADETGRRHEAEEANERMQKQLKRLEKETFDLRRQVAQTYEQAFRDPLTGLPNRRAYDERLAQEYARWKRFNDPLTLIVWDIDDFKLVNDRYGHAAGDRALALVGSILQARLRETDFIARYGGEEFVVLLAGAARDDAQRIAEDMRSSVENAGLHSHKQPVRITVSGGLSTFVQGDRLESGFERADRAMYQAKQQGKNRCLPG